MTRASPCGGAVVTAKIDNMSVSRYTDASGKYLITGLKPGQLQDFRDGLRIRVENGGQGHFNQYR